MEYSPKMNFCNFPLYLSGNIPIGLNTSKSTTWLPGGQLYKIWASSNYYLMWKRCLQTNRQIIKCSKARVYHFPSLTFFPLIMLWLVIFISLLICFLALIPFPSLFLLFSSSLSFVLPSSNPHRFFIHCFTLLIEEKILHMFS